jgi:hypothetical protein
MEHWTPRPAPANHSFTPVNPRFIPRCAIADYLESQLHAIAEAGYQNFLSEQMKRDE